MVKSIAYYTFDVIYFNIFQTSNTQTLMTKPYIIVLGNEKGGSGKTTTAMHLTFSLIYRNFRVAVLDLDLRQLSLNRYLENRSTYYSKTPHFQNLQMPCIFRLPLDVVYTNNDEKIEQYLTKLFDKCGFDFVVIDTPGSSTLLSQITHSFADLIVTPINDSFIDLDLIATVVGDDLKQMRPSLYSTMIWEQKIRRFKRDKKRIDWVIIRNRLSNLDSNNRRSVDRALQYLSKTLAFRIGSGFSERIIYRELFPFGLTLLDVIDNQSIVKITASHIAARQELRSFMSDLRISILNPDDFSNVLPLTERVISLTDIQTTEMTKED